MKIDLKQLTDRCCGNVELVEKLTLRFSESLPSSMAAISAAMDGHRYHDVNTLAHRLKGESGTMCANEISSLATEICTAVEADSYSQLSQLVGKLERATGECCQSISEYNFSFQSH